MECEECFPRNEFCQLFSRFPRRSLQIISRRANFAVNDKPSPFRHENFPFCLRSSRESIYYKHGSVRLRTGSMKRIIFPRAREYFFSRVMASRRRKVCKVLVPAKPTGVTLSVPLFIGRFLLVVNSYSSGKFSRPCYANEVIKLACRHWLTRVIHVSCQCKVLE